MKMTNSNFGEQTPSNSLAGQKPKSWPLLPVQCKNVQFLSNVTTEYKSIDALVCILTKDHYYALHLSLPNIIQTSNVLIA
jgi:hypothetical protein